jgi:hypothetical protein
MELQLNHAAAHPQLLLKSVPHCPDGASSRLQVMSSIYRPTPAPQDPLKIRADRVSLPRPDVAVAVACEVLECRV